LRYQVRGAPEVEIGESLPEIRHEGFDIVSSTARFMQRILQQHVRCCEFIDDGEVARLAPELIEPASDDGLVHFQIRHCASPALAWCRALYFRQQRADSHPIPGSEDSSPLIDRPASFCHCTARLRSISVSGFIRESTT